MFLSFWTKTRISIQHLFLFITMRQQSVARCKGISIQHLFLFIVEHICPDVDGAVISIQHLFLFIQTCALGHSQSCIYFNTTLVFIYLIFPSFLPAGAGIFQYNTCFYLSNVFPPFLISIIVIFPDKFNVSLNFSQPFLFFRHFLSNRLPTAILSGLPAFRIFFRLGKPIKAVHPAAFILHYLN